MAKKKRYYLQYIEGCTQKVKEFKSKEELYKFAAEFGANSYDNPDNWIDLAFEGDIILRSNKTVVE